MKIAINLLPAEFTQAELKKTKFYKIQIMGVVAILVTIFLASLTVALRILQSHNISLVQSAFSKEEKHVEEFKTSQATLLFLKNRLDVISSLASRKSKQNDSYQFLSEAIPPTVSISALTVDRLGSVTILAAFPDVLTLDGILYNLINDENSIFSKASIENLSRGRDGIFRISLKLSVK